MVAYDNGRGGITVLPDDKTPPAGLTAIPPGIFQDPKIIELEETPRRHRPRSVLAVFHRGRRAHQGPRRARAPRSVRVERRMPQPSPKSWSSGASRSRGSSGGRAGAAADTELVVDGQVIEFKDSLHHAPGT